MVSYALKGELLNARNWCTIPLTLRDEDHKRVVIVRNAICYVVIFIDVYLGGDINEAAR